MHSPAPQADWMSFVLHFIFGLIVAVIIGVFVAFEDYRLWMRAPLVMPFLSGAALLGGGVAAKWGDRLWASLSESAYTTDAPRHSRTSAWICSMCIFAGVVLTATSLFKQFH
ncbi:MAG: hypothetical protein EOP84_08295 [Verrucomicrobiaceae bacterium]|nr:MAG: hypothetical protein EOP84_08295 [Verrucomicrobiaceae bacterium]